MRLSVKPVSALIGLALMALASVLPLRAMAQSKEVVVVTTGGAYAALLDKLFFKPFTEATGITVKLVSASTAEAWAKLKAMNDAGKVEWDLLSGLDADLIARRDIVQKWDCSKMPLTQEQGIEGACQDYGVLRVIGTIGTLIYDKRELPNGGPQTWADFFDVKKYPGPRGMMDSGTPWDMLAIALLADGVDRKKLYPLDMDRAFKKLDQIKPNVAVWWKSGDQSQQILRNGEVVASVIWSGRGFMLMNEKQPVEMVVPGSLKSNGYWMLAKGAPNKENAMKLVDFFTTRPEAHVAFRRANFNDTINKAAVDLLTAEERKAALTTPENLKALVESDYQWISDHRQEVQDRWKRWISQ